MLTEKDRWAGLLTAREREGIAILHRSPLEQRKVLCLEESGPDKKSASSSEVVQS